MAFNLRYAMNLITDKERLDAAISQFHERNPAPALAVALVDRGRIAATWFLGNPNPQTPISWDTHTAFRIASMTKSFAAAALLLLRDEGKCRLDQQTGEFISDEILHERWRLVSLRELLSMTAAAVTDNDWADRYLDSDNEKYSSFLRQAPILAGESLRPLMSYSNLSFMVIGRLISAIAGIDARAFIRQRFLEPLVMKHTVWNFTELPGENGARGYRRLNDQWCEEPMLSVNGDGAAFAGLWSCLNDLATWVHFLSAEPGHGGHEDILCRRSRLELCENVAPLTAKLSKNAATGLAEYEYSGYGYGLRTTLFGGRSFAGHSGGLPGYGSHMRWDLQTGIGFIALANATYCPVWDLCRDTLSLCTYGGKASSEEEDRFVRAAGVRLLHAAADWASSPTLELLAPNVIPDMTREALDREMQRLARFCQAPSGQCTVRVTGFGKGKLECVLDEERAELDFIISPVEPITIQKLEFNGAVPP